MSVFSSLCNSIVDFGTKNSNPRTERITKITIHHMAGVSSGVDCANYHLRGNASSANYYIGNAGDIVGGVSEDRRAWTSGSSWNDQKAITIEVSNSVASEPWPVSDAAYKSTIKLCIDICKRYGISPHFTGDKNGSLTLHRFYQRTACPGDYLYQRHVSGMVENDIKAGMGKVFGEKDIWDYLMGKISNEYGVAGLMGNLYAESGLRANNLQNSFEKSLGMSDTEYTAAVDIGAYQNFVHDSAGYGLAQWTFWSRKQNLLAFKRSSGVSIGDCKMQLDFLYKELSEGYKSVLNGLITAKSVRQASDIVLTQYERPKDQSEAMKQKRASYGQVYYDKYASGKDLPYVVRIIVDTLNVREGAGTEYPIVMEVHKGSAYTIVEEQDGWGRLKSGVGWICLQYTERV